jgi:hypothetical protein
MDYHLYKKGGGNPRCTAATEMTLLGPSLVTTVVTAKTGKKIIPMWVVATTTAFGTRPVKIDVRSGTTDIVSEVIQSQSSWPLFLKFPDCRDKVGVNENLQIKAYGTASDKYYVTVGYYVIDG